MVKETYYQLYAVDKSLEIVEKNLKLLSDFVTIGGIEVFRGQGVQQDIYKAGLEKIQDARHADYPQATAQELEATSIIFSIVQEAHRSDPLPTLPSPNSYYPPSS